MDDTADSQLNREYRSVLLEFAEYVSKLDPDYANFHKNAPMWRNHYSKLLVIAERAMSPGASD